MKKILISLMMMMSMMMFTACGSNNDKGDSAPQEPQEYDLRSLGSVDDFVDEYGGSIYVDVFVPKAGIDKNNIKVIHQVDSVNRGGIGKPVVAVDGENYNIIADVSVKANQSGKVREHKVLLIYFTGAKETIYSARVLQDFIE